MKKRITMLLALVMSLSMVIGCGQTSEQKEDSSSDDSAKSENSADDADTSADIAAENVITYYSLWTESEPQAVALKEISENFEAETGIHVEITWVGRDVLTSAKNLILNDQAPDLIDHDCSELSAALLNSSEILAESVDDILDAEAYEGGSTMRELFNTEHLEMYAVDGTCYFVPYSYITSGFYYNKTEWAEMGLTVPGTWSELIECAEAFKAAGKPFLQVEGTQYDYSAYYYYLLCERIVGSGELLKASQDTTGAAWDNPGFLKAAELVYQLSQSDGNYFADGYTGNVWPAGQSNFALGGVGALLCGSWIPVELNSLVDENWEWGYFPMPAVEGYDGTVYDMEAYQIGWAIPSGAKNVEGAKLFMQYATTKENADLYVTTSDNMSARKDTLYPEVLSDVEEYLTNAESFYLSYDGVAAYSSEWTNNVFYPIDLELLAGSITPEEFVTKMKAETINFYENK